MQLEESPLAARLGRLADAGGTGALHVPGETGGLLYLQDGDVIYAESARTPGPDRELAPLPAWGPAVWESTVDAAHDLLSGVALQSPSRFRNDESPPVGEVARITVGAILDEVARRQKIAGQLSPALTADSVVVRNSDLAPRGARVSALQWALLIRVGDQSTPRSLAFDLQRSVFSTVMEVFRLIRLGLLAVAGEPGPAANRPLVSFIRSVPAQAMPRPELAQSESWIA